MLRLNHNKLPYNPNEIAKLSNYMGAFQLCGAFIFRTKFHVTSETISVYR